jgi:hypothetical protein
MPLLTVNVPPPDTKYPAALPPLMVPVRFVFPVTSVCAEAGAIPKGTIKPKQMLPAKSCTLGTALTSDIEDLSNKYHYKLLTLSAQSY